MSLKKNCAAVVLWLLAMTACDTGRNPAGPAIDHRAQLERQRNDVEYEIALRQAEIDGMENSARRPGVIGVSKQWLERHNQLKEEILQ